MQQLLRYIAIMVYRIWFYLFTTILIILFSPFLFLATLRHSWYNSFYWMARNLWAKPILFAMGTPLKVLWEARFKKGQSYLLVPNHTSMLDIMCMLALSPNPFVFVGKKELTQFPIFGFFYKRVCILVDRSDTKSRSSVYRKAQQRLKGGLSVCVFPEGRVPPTVVTLDRFKEGAFKMAITHSIPLVPILFYDNKTLFPFQFFKGRPGRSRARVFPFVATHNLQPKDSSSLRDTVRNTMLNALEQGPGF